MKHSSKFIAALFVSSTLMSPAAAQIGPGLNPPPVFQYVDDNGVNIVSGTIVKTLASISIGPGGPGSLVYNWSTSPAENGAVGGYITITQTPTIDTATVVLMGSSETFTSNHGVNIWTQAQGRPSTLAYSSATGNYTYTTADGSAGVFSKNLVTGGPQALTWGITSLTYPAGQVLTYYYTSIGNGNYLIRAVTSSLGYQLRLSSAYSGGVLLSAVLFNMNMETCDPLASTCTLTQIWPSLTLNDTTGAITDSTGRSVIWLNNASTYAQIIYPSGRTLTYTGTRDPITNDLIVSSFADGKGTWTYQYQPHQGAGVNFIYNPDNAAPRVINYSSDGTISQDQPVGGSALSITYGYNSKSQLTSIKVTGTTTSETDYSYDARGNLNQVRLISTTPGTPADILQNAVFPSTCTNVKTCNKPSSVTDGRGNTTDYTYDANSGQVATVTLPAPTAGAVRPQTRYTFAQQSAQYKNGSGTIISGSPVWMLTNTSACATLSTCAGTADEVKETVTYDVNHGLLPSFVSKGDGTGALTATNAYTYTGTGDVNTVDGPLAGTDDTARDYYDSMRRPLGSIGPDPDGAGPLKRLATRVTYDSDARPATTDIGTATGQGDNDLANMTSLQQQVTSYDGQSRIATIAVNAGGETYSLLQNSYTDAGQLDCRAVRMNPAAFGSLPTSACTLGTQGSFGPDRVTKYTYDAFVHPISVTSGYGTSDAATDLTNTYDSLGRLSTIKDAENNLTTLVYDGMNRLSQMQYPSATKGSGTSNPSDYEQLTYDANSNVTQLRVRNGATIGLSYDNLDRVIHKGGSAIADRDFTYDNLDRLLTGKFSTGGQGVTNTYDALSRLTSSSSNMGGTAHALAYQYDLAGRRTRTTWWDNFYVDYSRLVTGEINTVTAHPNSTTSTLLATYAYDDLRRTTSLTYGSNNTTSYTYDPVSRLSSVSHVFANSASNVTITLGDPGAMPPVPPYDPAGEITKETRSNDAYAFHPTNENTATTTNGLNEITPSATIAYDTNGNLTKNGSMTYTYDAENNLTSATGSPLGSVSLSYDPLNRLDTYNPSPLTRFIYDGQEVVAELDSSGNITRREVRGDGPDEILAEYNTADWRYFHTDERGSPIAWSDPAGNLNAVLTYDEYGNPASSNPGFFQYTGQMWMPNAVAYNYKARAYSPALGRFMQTDPAGYAAGMNLYAYVSDNPVNLADPAGLQNEPDCNLHQGECLFVFGHRPPNWNFINSFNWYQNTNQLDPLRGSEQLADKGHGYQLKNFVCRAQLNSQRRADILRRYSLPGHEGLLLSAGTYWAAPYGIPGGKVDVVFSQDYNSVTNYTRPLHLFVGSVFRQIYTNPSGTFIYTNGHGFAGSDFIGESRDFLNQILGAQIFQDEDTFARIYAYIRYPECRK